MKLQLSGAGMKHGGPSAPARLLPLTPSLSLWEREKVTQLFVEPSALDGSQAQPAFPPLPKGEGWGEGKVSVRILRSFACEPALPLRIPHSALHISP